MRSVLRATVVVAVAGLAVPLWALPASAATVNEPASVGAYFFRGGVTAQGLPAEPPQAIPNVTAEAADGVSPGNLAVAASGGQEDKVSFLGFALAELPLDATVEKALLVVPTVEGSTDDLVYGAAPERVRVCKAGDQGFFGEDGQSTMLAPDRLCEDFASEPGKLSADGKAYVFDVTALAATWAEANDGLALTVAEGAEASAFQIVFAPSDKAVLQYTFTAPPEEVTEEVGAVVDVPADPGTSLDGGSTDLGFDGEAVSPDAGFGSVDAPVVDLAPAPEVMAAPAPAPQTAPVATTQVASVRPSEVMDVATTTWLAGLGFALLLALLSLIMGDPTVPTGPKTPSRLSLALASRDGSSAPVALGRPATA